MAMVRPCPRCSELVPSGEWVRHQQAHRNAGKPKTSQRGYGTEHQRLREHYRRQIELGVVVVCPRCHERIWPGQKWDLGHVDGTDKKVYSGPEHAGCNKATAAYRASLYRASLT